MKINNNKGFWCCLPHCCAVVAKAVVAAGKLSPGGSTIAGAGLVGIILVGVLSLPLIWHIPAWTQAKANGTTATYQKTEQWPQGLMDQLPGGTPGRTLGN
jgi:hypothetical protein